eukprot:TRINITY_DN4557_c0_g1_i6.p3 TRINITY_DN4557_c0_g1~~TRINITY_DN4557_c0_g1_i6.p3  ORF type:complete len:132 (-),score=28.82 TRINITY_DN4557_c0_g1_i6:258-653(-)
MAMRRMRMWHPLCQQRSTTSRHWRYALGQVCSKRDEHKAAEEYYKQALTMYKQVYGDAPNASVASTLHALGQVCSDRDEHKAAEEYYKQALAMNKQVYGDAPNASVAATLYALGQVCSKRDEHAACIGKCV